MSKQLILVLTLAAATCSPNGAHTAAGDPAAQSPPTSAPKQQPASAPQIVTVGAFQLTLSGCKLTYDGMGRRGSVEFEFPQPCQFSRDRDGAVRIVQTGEAKTLLVEASQPAATSAGTAARDCVTQVRGIVVSATEIRLSVQTQKVAQCLPAVWDETMFHAFAARTEPFKTEG